MVKRFINADGVSQIAANGEFISYNLFSYCLNNPVNRFDNGGYLSSLAKLAIGASAIVIGAAFIAATASTGGTAAVFGSAVLAGLKSATIAGVAGAFAGAGASSVSHRISTGTWKGVGTAALKGGAEGFASGFMAGGITFAATSALGVLGQTAQGIKIGNTAKPQYGRINIGYGNSRVQGTTFFSLQKGSGKCLFRLEFDVSHYLHWHYGATNRLLNIHRPANWVYTFWGGLSGATQRTR